MIERAHSLSSVAALALSCLLCAASPAARARADEAADSEPALGLRVFAGAGLGGRSFEWPGAGERLAVETGAFANVDLGLSFWLAASERLWIGPALTYQTSVGAQVEETHIAGSSDQLSLRSHRFEGMLAVTARLGQQGGFWIVPALGYGLRNLKPEVHHLLTPTTTLAGPLLRLAVRIPIGDNFALRIAPELQWILVVEQLEDLGLHDSGLGFGGELGFEIAVGGDLSIELAARGSQARVDSDLGATAVDVERLVTARLVWQP